MTDAELKLWRGLRQQQLEGFKFRRQYPVGLFIADFVCLEMSLIVEVDGGQHNESARDEARTAWLKAQGFTVLRFWNDQVLKETDSVLQEILSSLKSLTPTLALPRKRGRVTARQES